MKRVKLKDFILDHLFVLKPGAFHATSELEGGSVPLISCGEENNGLIGYFDVPLEKTHDRALTVSFNGFPLTTNFHPYQFGAKDDVAVLIPRSPMSDATLIYIAALLNGMKWRYSYGRKCYREKLKQVVVPMPVMPGGQIDETVPTALFAQAYDRVKQSAVESLAKLLVVG